MPPEPHISIPETYDFPVREETPSPTPPEAASRPTIAGPSPRRSEREAGGSLAIVVGTIAFSFVSISLALLRWGGETWSGVLPLLTLVGLGTSFVGLLVQRGAWKVFWQGFATFGFGYFVLAFLPAIPRQAGLELPTTRLIGSAYAWAVAPAAGTSSSSKTGVVLGEIASPRSDADLAGRAGPPAASVPSPDNFKVALIIGHCWFTILAAATGSMIARWLDRVGVAST